MKLKNVLRAVRFVVGVAIMFVGFGIFGACFDFIDAHRQWPGWMIAPAIVAFGVMSLALVVVGFSVAAIPDEVFE